MTKGYRLPVIPDTSETVCFTIQVPNRPEYILAFKGQVDMLGYWWLWERGPLKNGRIAARLWREARETLCMDGNCVPTQNIKSGTKEEVAAWVVNIYYLLISIIVISIDDGDDGPKRREEAGSAIKGVLPGKDLSKAIDSACTKVEQTPYAIRKDWKDSPVWDDLFMSAACNQDPAQGFLDVWADAIAAWLAASAEWVAEALSETATLFAGQDYNRSSYMGGGGGGFEGFRVACNYIRVATFSVDSTDPLYQAIPYATTPGLDYRVNISGLVNGDTGQDCLTDPEYVPTRVPGCLPWVKRTNISFDAGGLAEDVEAAREDHSYWWLGGTGDGTQWGVRFEDVNYLDNDGAFEGSLWEEIP